MGNVLGRDGVPGAPRVSGWEEHEMSAEWSHFGMSIALGRPEQCHEEVTRGGELEPCEKVAVALRLDPQESEPYPVCAHHARGDMVSLEAIVRFMLDRHNTQEVVARKLVEMASGSTAQDHANGGPEHG